MSVRTLWITAVLFMMVGGLLPVPAARAQDSPQIVASFSILADVAAQVAGDAAAVTALTPLEADPHSFTPAPRDLVMLAEADIVLLVGAGFEASLRQSINGAGDDLPLVMVSSCVDVLPFGLTPADHAETDQAEETEADHDEPAGALAEPCAAHRAELAELEFLPDHDAAGATLGPLYALACDEGADDHDHEAGSCDPHVWLDPHNVMLWTLMIRDTLAERDPANADLYAANAAAYLEQLAERAVSVWGPALDSVPPANRKLVANHGTLGYLAHWAGYEIAGLVIPSASAMAEASAAETAALIDLIRAEDVPAIFAETTTSPRLAEQVAAETGASFHTLFTGSLSEEDGPAATYIDYMDYNISTIVNALGGTFAAPDA